jgi:hypothetical protein
VPYARRRYACAAAKAKHPPEAEPFDVTFPEGFELGEHRATLDEAAKQSGWTVERDAARIVDRDVWTENQDHAAWPVATKVGLPLERVTVLRLIARQYPRGRALLLVAVEHDAMNDVYAQEEDGQ